MAIDRYLRTALISLFVTVVFVIVIFYSNSAGFFDLTGDIISNPLETKYCEENNLNSKANYECLGDTEYYGCYRTDEWDLYQKGSLCVYRVSDDKKICIYEDFCGEGVGSLNQIECVSDSEYKAKWYGCPHGCEEGVCVRD